jgi:hypothetical protein
MFNKLKQYKDLRDKAKQLQSSLATEKVEGSGGWGKVKIEMDGNQTITNLTVADELLAPGQKDKLQSALKDALQDTLRKAQKVMMEKMKGMGGFDIPGMK